jgi:1,4-dihydroxy-2-naphthoate octaprenyltransferase
MSKAKAILKSARLRTLPLSESGILLGCLLALSDYRVKFVTILLVVLTAGLLQVLSNLSNELGDALNGTDSADRQGPQYSIQSGELSVKDMKKAIAWTVVLASVSGLAMIWQTFGTLFSIEAICFELLGAAAIIAAMRYTLGRNPYGYRGLGDLYVFLFFGLVTVLGSYFLCAHTIPTWFLLLPAASIGFFSVGVLNVNNIRDMKTDAENRVTIAMKLGLRNARIYQTVLVVLGICCMAAFCVFRFPDWRHWLWILTIPLYIIHLKMVWTRTDRDLDPALPELVMSTFALAVLAGAGFCLFLI